MLNAKNLYRYNNLYKKKNKIDKKFQEKIK